MASAHTDRPDDHVVERDADLGDMSNVALLGEVCSLAREMTIAIINSHREERSHRLARTKYDRLHTAMTIVYNRQFDQIVEKDEEIAHLREALDMSTDEYEDVKNRLETLRDGLENIDLPCWKADRTEIQNLRRQLEEARNRIAVLRIQNQMRQIRLLNPPPVIPPIAPPPPQPTNQVWLLL
jgi:chromosome segregation ATPase